MLFRFSVVPDGARQPSLSLTVSRTLFSLFELLAIAPHTDNLCIILVSRQIDVKPKHTQLIGVHYSRLLLPTGQSNCRCSLANLLPLGLACEFSQQSPFA